MIRMEEDWQTTTTIRQWSRSFYTDSVPQTDETWCHLQRTYRRKGRIATAGDLFGSLVSDLIPKSTVVSRFHWALFPVRFGIQQQLAALMNASIRKHIKTFISYYKHNKYIKNMLGTKVKEQLTWVEKVCYSGGLSCWRFQFHTIACWIVVHWCCFQSHPSHFFGHNHNCLGNNSSRESNSTHQRCPCSEGPPGRRSSS